MNGTLRQIEKTTTNVSFEIVAVKPPADDELVQYLLLNIDGKLRLGRKLLAGEYINDFPLSNLLYAENHVVYILPEGFKETELQAMFQHCMLSEVKKERGEIA